MRIGEVLTMVDGMKHCSRCKFCVLDTRAIMLCGVFIKKCTKKGHNILHPFFSGFRCEKFKKKG